MDRIERISTSSPVLLLLNTGRRDGSLRPKSGNSILRTRIKNIKAQLNAICNITPKERDFELLTYWENLHL